MGRFKAVKFVIDFSKDFSSDFEERSDDPQKITPEKARYSFSATL